jgi:hypothetical protein
MAHVQLPVAAMAAAATAEAAAEAAQHRRSVDGRYVCEVRAYYRRRCWAECRSRAPAIRAGPKYALLPICATARAHSACGNLPVLRYGKYQMHMRITLALACAQQHTYLELAQHVRHTHLVELSID